MEQGEHIDGYMGSIYSKAYRVRMIKDQGHFDVMRYRKVHGVEGFSCEPFIHGIGINIY